mgnify:CR=1 FL=1
MAIINEMLGDGDTTILTVPAGKQYAVLTILLCNTSDISASDFTMYFVPGDGVSGPSVGTMVVNSMPLSAAETFTFDTEKLILNEGDRVVLATSTPFDIITATISFMEV